MYEKSAQAFEDAQTLKKAIYNVPDGVAGWFDFDWTLERVEEDAQRARLALHEYAARVADRCAASAARRRNANFRRVDELYEVAYRALASEARDQVSGMARAVAQDCLGRTLDKD